MASSESRSGKLTILLFLLRNLILAALLANGYLHFRESLNPLFLTVVFLTAILLALFMQAIRLRLPVCFALFLLLAFCCRLLVFLIFNLALTPDKLSDADFLFFHFDKDFFPALIPGFIAWLFNLLALRFKKFVFIETGLNGLLLLVVFLTEINYNITLYHPTLFALLLAGFILVQIVILMLNWLLLNYRLAGKKTGLSPVYLLFILPILLVLFLNFLLMKKYNEGAVKNRGGLMESTLFRFDFSRFIKLESEIKLSDDLVMLMRKNGPATRILIRRFVLSGYESARGFFQFQAGDFNETPLIVPDSPLHLPDPGYRAREPVDQEYFFVNLDPTALVALNEPVDIVPLKNWDASSFLRIYRVTSRVNQEEPDALWLSRIPDMEEAAYRFYTAYAGDEAIKNLAEEVTTGLFAYTDRVLAIRDYLQENYFYSLQPGLAEDGNQLHHFLFSSGKGYCSYFAFAMALMCRSLGIPARVAVGFAAVPGWEVLNFYEIRANLAHAWVEVYFGDYGWIEFDPTSSNLAEGEDLEFLTEFKPGEDLKNLIGEILANQDNLEAAEEEAATAAPSLSRAIQELWQNFRSLFTRTWYLSLPVLYLLTLLSLKLNSYFRYLITRDRRKKARHLFRHSLVLLYNFGWVKRTDESPGEYAVRMEAEHHLTCSAWTASYLKAVFAGDFSYADYETHLRQYAAFRAAYNRQANLLLRLLAFLNPVHSLQQKDF